MQTVRHRRNIRTLPHTRLSQEFMLLVRVLTQSLKIVSILALTVLVIAGAVAFFDYWTDRQQSDQIGRPVTITITEDDDGGSVADKLTDAELVQYGFYFETMFRFSGDDLRPGSYILRHGMSVSDIIDAISVPSEEEVEEDLVDEAATEIQVTFVEGERIEQYAETLVEAGWTGDPEEFIDLARNPANPGAWDFLSDLPDGGSLEGFLFPDTYTLPSDAAPQDVIDYMLSNFDARFTDDMREQANAVGMSIYEVVTLASIVEREAAVPEERPVVAGLYLNRLDAGMELQADPTLQYVVGNADEWWPVLNTQLLEQADGSPYDTYPPNSVPGLPFGPISNPGLRSIQAVLNPDPNDFIYMMAKDDGSGTHAFAVTLEEHEENICTYDPDAEVCTGADAGSTQRDLWVVPERREVVARRMGRGARWSSLA